MVEAIEQSPVPVAIYIAPSGSRAGSAGFFLLESADIAAMAPGTNAGAAHPIVEGRTMDPVLKLKIENDAAAFLRSYTTRRNRNPAAAEDAVRNSKSYSDTEALNLHLIDLIAPDESTLLADLDNRTIHRFDGSALTLHLHNPAVVTLLPSLRERLLSRLTNPDLAILLLTLGGLLIYLEFNIPGTIVPGSLGLLLVLLSLFALNLLPIHHASIFLLLTSVTLILLELKFPSHGILALAGIGALTFGLATLVDGPIPELRVHLATALAAGTGFGIVTFGLAWIALRARRNKVTTGPQAMIGALATARTHLRPAGQIEVRGELWQATLVSPTQPDPPALPPGSIVRIRALDPHNSLLLLVEPAPTVPNTAK
jgi:membrane-bound serine protease (ClpP class)